MSAKIIFVTGTDTGVGKTVFTALMLDYLRARKVHALALKPFCSGARSDARVLHSLQGEELRLDDVNPYWFSEPVAPLVAARNEKRSVGFQEICARIKKAAAGCDYLLVEGAGGLLAPLGDLYSLLDLINALPGLVVVVGRNALGTLNHTLLTLRALEGRSEQGSPRRKRQRYAIVLMNQRRPDGSGRTNVRVLRELIGKEFAAALPYFGMHPIAAEHIEQNQKKIRKTLARIFEMSSVVALFFVT